MALLCIHNVYKNKECVQPEDIPKVNKLNICLISDLLALCNKYIQLQSEAYIHSPWT